MFCVFACFPWTYSFAHARVHETAWLMCGCGPMNTRRSSRQNPLISDLCHVTSSHRTPSGTYITGPNCEQMNTYKQALECGCTLARPWETGVHVSFIQTRSSSPSFSSTSSWGVVNIAITQSCGITIVIIFDLLSVPVVTVPPGRHCANIFSLFRCFDYRFASVLCQ